MVVEGDGVLFGKFEGEGEDAAVAVFVAGVAVVGLVVGEAGVPDVFDGGMFFEKFGNLEGVAVDGFNPLGKVVGVFMQLLEVGAKAVGLLLGLLEEGLEGGIVGAVGVEKEGTAHGIAFAGEVFGEADGGDVGEGVDVEVEAGGEGFVEDDGEWLGVGEGA